MKPQVELAIWGFFMQRRDALHNALFGEFSSGNEDGRMNAERTARGPLESSTLTALSLPQCPLHQARSAVKQRLGECYYESYAHLRRVFVVKTTCRKPRLSEYGLRARLTSVGDGVPQGVEYRSPVGAAPL